MANAYQKESNTHSKQVIKIQT